MTCCYNTIVNQMMLQYPCKSKDGDGLGDQIL